MQNESVINQFTEFCQGMVNSIPSLTVPEESYLPTVRMFFRLFSAEINRLLSKNNDTKFLSAQLKEIAWNTLEKYRDEFLSRK